MNTGELMQAVQDAGCEFDCTVNGDLYKYLRKIDETWVMLPKAFAWVTDDPRAPNNARLVMSISHVHNKTYDVWRIGSLYSKVDIVYDYPTGEAGHERVPVAIELVESEDLYEEREHLTNPGALTTFLRDLLDEVRATTKEIRAAQVRIAAKEYEL